MINHKDVATAV